LFIHIAAAAPPVTAAGDTAWVLASAALVLLMTPGLAFFYGGMVRGKNVLGMLMQNYVAIGIVSVLWVLVVYSLAFSSNGFGGFAGNLHQFGLAHMNEPVAGEAIGYSFVATMIIGLALKYTIGIRISEEEELVGMDASLHAESAYDFNALTSGTFSSSFSTVSLGHRTESPADKAEVSS
jgi:ammonia channel protein AmtB